jgi:hypothetical protein
MEVNVKVQPGTDDTPLFATVADLPDFRTLRFASYEMVNYVHLDLNT